LIEDIPALNEASPTVPHADSTVPPPVPIHPAPHKEPDHVVALSHLETDAWTRSVQDHLIKQKAARPRTLKSLLNTIHAKCGKGVSEDQVKIVYQKLVHRGYVKLQGTRVVYNLPAS
jgi:hypothetical protein